MTDTADWKQQVAEWRASDKTAEEFSKERGFTRARLWAWSSRLRKMERTAAAGEEVRLVQVVRKRPPAVDNAPVIVELHDARIHVRTGVDRATLTSVLEAFDVLRRTAGARQ